MSSDQRDQSGAAGASETRAQDGPGTPLAAFAWRPVGIVTLLFTAVQAALSGRYGFHRDELYFMAAGDEPDWGYVDNPPLTPLVARASTAVFGDSPSGLRVAAMLAGAASVLLVALIARELGGRARVQGFAAVLAAVSGYVLASGHMVSTSTFDLLSWLAIAWAAMRLLRTGDGRWWPVLGVALGVGLFNKHLVVLLAAGLLIGVLAVGPRAVLRGKWPAVAVVVVALAALPTVWWQIDHDWPQLEVAEGISEDDGGENRAMFVPYQLLMLSPVFVPIWIAGLVRLLRDPGVRWARPVAVAYPPVCLAVLVLGGKSYYAVPLLLVLAAAGCEPVLRWAGGGWRTVRGGLLVAAVAVSAVVNAVVTLPVLPPSALAVPMALNQEQGEQVGWPELADAAAAAWQRIPAEQRPRAVVFAGNYGEAGALAQYGLGRGLPKPYSGHMSFADWGPPPDSSDGPVLFVHVDGVVGQERYFVGCELVGRVDNGEDVDNEEQDAEIQLCAGTTQPWSALWPQLRRFS